MRLLKRSRLRRAGPASPCAAPLSSARAAPGRAPSRRSRPRPRPQARRPRSAPRCRDRACLLAVQHGAQRAALCSGSPPFRSSGLARSAGPTSSGVTVKRRIAPFSSAATWVWPVVVISSRPSRAVHHPDALGAQLLSTSASGSSQLSEKTPRSWRLTPAGLESGPSRLKIVRVPSSTRTGATWRMEAWWVWREHEADAGLRRCSAVSRPARARP